MEKKKRIVNWRQVSTLLSGNPEYIRSGYKSGKYQEAVNELLEFTEKWVKKHEK